VLAVIGEASPDTYKHFQEASDGPRAPHAAASAPLIYKGKALGALVVDAFQNKGGFVPEDLEMLERFAQIAAIAIVNARLYESEHANRVRLEVLNNEITRRRDELEQRVAAIDSMAQLARQELGLGALASLLAKLTSAHVFILDGLARTRAVEPAAMKPERAGDLLESAACASLLDRVGADFQPKWSICGNVHIAATPIVGGSALLGYLVVEATEPSAPEIIMALSEIAALFASSVFVRERALEEGVVRGRVDLLERLLDGNVPKSSRSFQSLPPPLRLAVGKIHSSKGGKGSFVSDGNVLREVCSTTQQILKAQSAPIAVAIRGECVVVAWSCGQRDVKFNAMAKLEEIAAQVLSAASMQIRFVLSDVAKDPMLVPQLFNEARLAVGLRHWGDSVVIDSAMLGAYRLIIGALSSNHAIEFSRQTLSKVILHDRNNSGCLTSTLRAYLERSASLTLTARQLGVHVHTVRYRLTKIEELTGLSLSSTEDRLTLELAFRILALTETDTPDKPAKLA
jgi:PucR C-terminal helix-turn-helix domain/GAF domain